MCSIIAQSCRVHCKILLCNDTDLAFALKQAVCAQGFGKGTLSPDCTAMQCQGIALYCIALQCVAVRCILVVDCNGNKLASSHSDAACFQERPKLSRSSSAAGKTPSLHSFTYLQLPSCSCIQILLDKMHQHSWTHLVPNVRFQCFQTNCLETFSGPILLTAT